MSSWLLIMHMDAMMKEVKMGKERRGGSRDYLASCMQMTWLCMVNRKKALLGSFVEMCRGGLKFNEDKSKVMVLNGEKRAWWDC